MGIGISVMKGHETALTLVLVWDEREGKKGEPSSSSSIVPRRGGMRLEDENGSLQPHEESWATVIILDSHILFRLKRQSPFDDGGAGETLNSWSEKEGVALGLGESKFRNKGSLCNNLVVPRPRNLRLSLHQKKQEVAGQAGLAWL